MTNSYRRTQRGQKRDWLPEISKGDITGWRRYGYYFEPDSKKIYWLSKNPHRVSDIDDWFFWLSCEPSWWQRMYSTVPRRRKERRLLRKVLKEEIDPDDTVWPLHTKPHHWYW